MHMDASPHFAPCLRKGLLFTAASTRLAGLCVSEECVAFASHFVDKNAGVADHVCFGGLNSGCHAGGASVPYSTSFQPLSTVWEKSIS